MKGYYTIYNHYTNAWWSYGSYWQVDRDIQTISMPTTIDLTKITMPDGSKDIMMAKYDTKDVLVDGKGKVNPNNIWKFHTLKDAEDYLMSGSIITNYGQDFLKIRKIYY